jgi:hypothetical protein
MRKPKAAKTSQTFAKFCKKHKIAKDSIQWRTIGDKSVKISINHKDFESGGWNLISVSLMFALREFGINLDVTLRENSKELEIILEK